MAISLLDLPREMRNWIYYYADMPLKVCHVYYAETAGHFNLMYSYIRQSQLLLVNQQIYEEVRTERDQAPLPQVIHELNMLSEELDVLTLKGTAEAWTGAAALWCKESVFVIGEGGICFLKTMVNKKGEGLITKLILSVNGLHVQGYDEWEPNVASTTDDDRPTHIDFFTEDVSDPDIFDHYYNQHSEPEEEESDEEDEVAEGAEDTESAEPEEEEEDDDVSGIGSIDSDESDSLFWADWDVLRRRLLLHPLSRVFLLLDNDMPTQLPWKLLELLHEGRIPTFSLLYGRRPDGSFRTYMMEISRALGTGSINVTLFEAWYATYSRNFLVSMEVAPVGGCFFGIMDAEVMVTFRMK